MTLGTLHLFFCEVGLSLLLLSVLSCWVDVSWGTAVSLESTPCSSVAVLPMHQGSKGPFPFASVWVHLPEEEVSVRVRVCVHHSFAPGSSSCFTLKYLVDFQQALKIFAYSFLSLWQEVFLLQN